MSEHFYVSFITDADGKTIAVGPMSHDAARGLLLKLNNAIDIRDRRIVTEFPAAMAPDHIIDVLTMCAWLHNAAHAAAVGR